MKIYDIIGAIEEVAPRELAAEWDNTGLAVGDAHAEARGVLLALDCGFSEIAQASENGCNLIITHHPLLFRPLQSMDMALSKSRIIAQLLKNDMALYSAHTNLDAAENGLCAYLCRQFGGSNIARRGEGFSAEIKPVSLRELALKVSDALGDNSVKAAGNPDRTVKSVYVVSGAGGGHEEYEQAKACADVFISGEIKHSVYIDAINDGCSLIEFSHYCSEIAACDILKEAIKRHFGDIKIIIAKQRRPFRTVEEL